MVEVVESLDLRAMTGGYRGSGRPSAYWSKGVEAPLCQVGNARGEIEAEQICQGEVVIADGVAIGVLRSNAQVGLGIEQAIDDIGGFAGRRDRNHMVVRLASREVRMEKCGCGAFVMGVDRSDSFPRPGSREVLSIRAGA